MQRFPLSAVALPAYRGNASAWCRVYMATRFYQAMRENAFTIIIAALCVYDAVIIWLLLDG